MFAVLISVAISIAFIVGSTIAHYTKGATVAVGIVAFTAVHFLIGFLIRKKSEVIKKDLEGIVLGGQKRINRKVQQFQSKPGANPKVLQLQLEADQKLVFKQALDFIDHFEPLKKWSPLMGKQMATMRLQFLYQLKEFEAVDALLAEGFLKSPLLMEPLMVAMKMARQFKNKDIEGAEKTFNFRIKWFRGNRGTLLYGLMSWIYMKEGETEKARQLLNKAKDVTASEVLARNWELLSNCKEKRFSNAGLGDEWFGLYLENPPAPKQQRMRGNAKGAPKF